MSLTDQGLTVQRTADFLATIQASYIASAGLPEGTDLSDDTLLGVFAGVIAARLDALSQLVQAVYDSFDENNASGAQLDNINGLRGVRRNRGDKSRVPGTLTGTDGAVIAAGVVVQGGGTDGAARWVSLESVTLTGGSASVTWEAEDVGATSVDAGSALIVTPRSGLSAAAFTSPVTLGTAREADDAYRLRGALSVSAAGAHTLGAMLAAVLAVDGVTDADVLDNPDNTSQAFGAITLGPHRTIVYVLPEPLDSETQTAVLDAIADNFTVGIQTAATDVTRTETDATTGASYTIGFDYGTELTPTIVATLTLASGYGLADASASLQAAIDAHVATLNMGDPLRHLTLCQLAAGISGINGASFTIDGLSTDLVPERNEAVATVTFSAVSA